MEEQVVQVDRLSVDTAAVTSSQPAVVSGAIRYPRLFWAAVIAFGLNFCLLLWLEFSSKDEFHRHSYVAQDDAALDDAGDYDTSDKPSPTAADADLTAPQPSATAPVLNKVKPILTVVNLQPESPMPTASAPGVPRASEMPRFSNAPKASAPADPRPKPPITALPARSTVPLPAPPPVRTVPPSTMPAQTQQ